MTACLVVLPLTAASATGLPSTAEIKAYAQGYVTAKGGLSQWKCFNRVIHYESRWNHRAVNGRYYGLGQMANAKARHSGKPYLQVRDAWKYMVHRYDGDACGAWSHINRVGWY
jgi:hypothetical protein